MFLDNKYTKWHNAIIERAKNRAIEGYCERHHVIPESLGGPNTKENIVKLTAREHFIVHLLLIRMMDNTNAKMKMINAAWYFQGNIKHSELKINGHTYECLKRQKSLAQKAYIQTPEEKIKRAKSNTGKKRTEETKQKMRDASVLYYASRTKEHQKLQSEKMSVSKSKSWKIESGDILIVTNLKKFSEEHGMIGTVFYTTQISGKYINGFRAVGKI